MAEVAGRKVGKSLGFGLMGFTWREKKTADEVAFQLLNTNLANGVNLWSSAEFYGLPKDARANIDLLHRYFEENPNAEPVLAIKGGLAIDDSNTCSMMPDLSKEGIEKSVAEIQKALGSHRKIDVFLPARMLHGTDIEKVVGIMDDLRKRGKIGGIGLSEISAEAVKRAVKVAKIDLVEIEFSLFTTDPLTNGLVDVCAENNIPIMAYSPLSRGFLSGQVFTRDNLDAVQQRMPRYSEENFPKNLELVEKLKQMAEKMGIALPQLAIAWLTYQKGTVIPIPGCTTIDRLKQNIGSKNVKLSSEQLREINNSLSNMGAVAGERYPSNMPKWA